MIMNVIEPERGVMLDPACGSGGMFVSASDYVREHGGSPSDSMAYYGQEKVEYNARLCLMNMAVHGMNGAILSGDGANTFYHDAHSLDGQCDYVAANPPFNVDKVKAEEAMEAGRMPLGVSGINKAGNFSNANYLWINYFYSYLNPTGRAGFVMASSATDSSGKDRALRERLVRTGHVDVMLYVGNNFFYTKSLPCTLWFLDKGKPEGLLDKVLFVDAQSYHTAVDTTHNEWSPWQLKNLTAIVWLYRGETDRYAALLEEYCAEIRGMAELVGDEAGGVLGGVDSIDGFAAARDALAGHIDGLRARAKADVEAARPRERKRLRAAYDEELGELGAALTVVDEALWLTGRFGAGEYADVPGLCKIATIGEIEERNWSLTPGAHVGVPPQEDDGVDFHERMGEIHEELLRLQAESDDLMATISKNFEGLGA